MGGLRAIVLDTLKTWPQMKVVAIKHEIMGWKIHIISESDLISLEKEND